MSGDGCEVHAACSHREQRERRDDQQKTRLGQGEEPERARRDDRLALVAEDHEVGRQRHRLPRDEEHRDIAGDQHDQRGEQGEVVHREVGARCAAGMVIARDVQPCGQRDHAEQCDEDPRERGRAQCHGAHGCRAAQRRLLRPVDEQPAAADERGRASDSCRHRGRREPDHPHGTECRRGSGQPHSGGHDEQYRRHRHGATPSSTMNDIADAFSASRPTATSSPCRSAIGVGGQPGT